MAKIEVLFRIFVDMRLNFITIMKQVFTILATFAFILSSINASAQEAQETIDSTAQKLMGYAAALNNFGKALPQEKVYLHLDNTSYYQGDKIWFQAYVVTADNKPTALSRTLYVELLNAGGTVVNKVTLPIVNGRCNGDFALTHLPFHSGFFEIRAYTKYMTNFGEDVIFSRVIPVFDKPEKEGNFEEKKMLRMRTKNSRYVVKREWEERSEEVTLKFFPEGGNLVAGVASQVAFEATDQGGAPLEIKGRIVSKGGDTKGEFATRHEGRGVFEYTPSEGDKAEVEYRGKNYKFDLYQKMGEEYIRYYYTGTYEFDGKILTGTYTGYIPFAHEYNVSRSGDKLTLTSVSEPDHSVTYTKKSIPEEVKTHFVPVTKSAEVAPVPFL